MNSRVVIVAVLVLLLMARGVAVEVDERDTVIGALRAAFTRYGLDPDWGEALAITESNAELSAVNNTGGDGARGGSYGPTQITAMTAEAFGYTGDLMEFTRDPDLAAEWTARIASAGNPKTIDDLGAWWNAGRYHASDLPAGHRTLTKYLPRLRAALEGIV